MSEKALEFLSQTEFKKGIVGNIPSDVKVAHKFGERTYLSSTGTLVYKELHDCGIVYASNNPYVLCVMTRGNDFEKLEDLIQSISQTAYETLSSNISATGK